MTWVWRAAAAGGVLMAALGLFWLAQGTGLVVVDPILCTGDCTPVEAPSVQWQVTGGLTCLVGAGLGSLALRRSRRRDTSPALPTGSPAPEPSTAVAEHGRVVLDGLRRTNESADKTRSDTGLTIER